MKNFFRHLWSVPLFLLGVFISTSLFTQVHAQVQGYRFFRDVTIRNNGGTPTPANYQVGFAVDLQALINAGKLRADRGDIRLTLLPSDCRVFLPHWIEDSISNFNAPPPGNFNGWGIIWTQLATPIPAGGSVTIRMNYGNPAGTSIENGFNVFDFFDDFATGPLNARWTNCPGITWAQTATVNGMTRGYAHMPNPPQGDIGMLYSTTFTAQTAIVESDFYYFNNSCGGCWTHGSGLCFRKQGAGGSNIAWGPWYGNRYNIGNVPGSCQALFGNPIVSDFCGGNNCHTPPMWNKFSVRMNANNINFRVMVGTNAPVNLNANASFANGNVGFGAFQNSYFDWFRVRKLHSPEPVPSVGTEQLNEVVVTPNPVPPRCAQDPPTQLSATYTLNGADFLWLPDNFVGSVFNASPAVTTTYTVQATFPGTNCGGSASVTVTVLPAPVLTPTRTPLGTVCPGQSVQLDAGGNANNYTWTPSPCTPNCNQRVVTVNPQTTTIYTVTGPGANGCIGTGTIQVTVFNNPINVAINPANPTRCSADAPTQLTASGAATYVWQGGGAELSARNIANPTSAATVTTTYTVVGTSVDGCTGSATVTVLVTPTPNQPGTITGPALNCLGNTPVRYSVPFAANVDVTWTSDEPLVTFACASPSCDRVDVTFPPTIVGPYPRTVSLIATPRTGACVGPPRTTTVSLLTNPVQPAAITGPVSLCPGDVGSYNILAVPTALNYLWTVSPAGPVITGNGTTDVTVRFPAAGTFTLRVEPSNQCGSGPVRSLTVTVNPNPPAPTIANITNPVCPNQQNTTYTVNDISGTSYNWTVPAGVTIASGQGTNSISVNWGNQAPGLYNIRVVPTRLGCVGATLTIPILMQDPPPPAPSPIVGRSPVCQNATENYQVNLLPTATAYTWDISPSGPTITGQGTNIISIDWGTNPRGTYNLSVTASNSCGVSPATTRTVILESIPVSPGSISGPPFHCLDSQRTYTVPPVSNATSYTWTNSCGWSGSSNTNSITYTATTLGPCVISVTANNFCGNSPVTTLTVNPIDVPAQPSQILGVALVCRNQVENYSVVSAPNVTYTWSGLPNGATITSGQGTNSISIDWGAANPGTYALRVIPSNVCGNGVEQTLAVTVRTVPAQPQGLSGPTDVCEDAVSTFSLINVIGVTYTWSISPNGPVLIPSGSSAVVNWNNRPGVYVLTVTPSNPCGNGTSASITIRVSDRPNVNGGMDMVVCGPNTVLIGSPVGGVWSCEVCPAPAQIVSAGPFGIVTRMSPALHVFKYSVTDPVCGLTEDLVTVRNDLPIPGTVVGDATVCGGTNGTLQLIGYTPGARIVRWESSTDNFISSNQIGNFSDTYTYNNISQTTQFRAVLEMNGLCSAIHSGHSTITVRPNSPADVLNSLVTVCVNEAVVNAVAPVSGSGSWSFVSGPGGAQIVTSGVQGIISGLNVAGDYVFRWRVVNPPCTASSRDVVVRRLDGVPAANAGANQRVCSDNATLVGNLPPGISGSWSFVSGPPAVVVTAGQTGLVSGMSVPGDYVFRWTLTNALCNQTTFSDVVVSRFAPVSQASAGQNQQVCGTSATLVGNRPQSGTGVWSLVSAPIGSVPSVTTNGEIGTVLNMTVVGDYVFRWTISNGVCPSSSSDVTITKSNSGSNASVPVNNYTICDRAEIVLRANPAVGGTGVWEFLQGPVSPVSVSTVGSDGQVSGMSATGVYRFRWVVSNGCGRSEVIVTVNRGSSFSPPPFAGANQNLCEISNTLLIGSAVPAGYMGVWRFVSGPMVASVATFGNFGSVVNMALPGPYVFVWEVGNGNICPTQVAQVTVTRSANVTPADAGSNQIICGTGTTLQGNVPLVGVGSWAFVDGPRTAGVSFTNNVASVSGMDDAGVYTFRYTISNPPCANSTADVRVTVNPGTIAGNLGGGGTVCAGQNGGNLSLSGWRGDIVRWEVSNDNFVSFNIVNNQSSTQAYSNLTRTTWYRAIVKNGSCPEMMSNSVRITVNSAPVSANAGGNRTICGTSVNLEGNDPMGGTGTWLQVSGPSGSSLVQAGRLAIITNMSAGTYVFSYTISVSGCGQTVSNAVITVRENSFGGVVSSNQTVCGPMNIGQLVLTGNVGTVLRWESSTDNFANATVYQNTSNVLTFNDLTETTQFRAVVKNGSCSEAFAQAATVFVRSGGSAANAGMDMETCNMGITLIGNGGIGVWTFESGPSSSVTLLSNMNEVTVSGMDVEGEYVFRYTIDDPICGTSFDEAVVKKYASSNGGAVSQDVSVCTGNNSGQLQLGGYAGEIIRWEESVNNWLTWVNINNTTPTLEFFNLTQTTQFRGVVKNGVCDEAKSFHATVYVLNEVTAANAGLDQVICGSGTSLQGNNINGVWSYISGPQSPILTQASGVAQANGLVAGLYRFMFEVTNGACGTTSDVAEVRVQPMVMGGSVSTDLTVCGNINSGILTLTGQTGNILSWESSTDAFVTTSVINNTNSIQTFNNLTRTLWFRAKTGLPGCADAYSGPAKVTVLGMTEPANAGFDQDICGSTAVLTGNMLMSGTGTWSIVSVPAGVNPRLTQSGNLAQVDGMTLSGTYVFKYMVMNGNCPSTSDDVSIRVSSSSSGGQLSTSTPAVCRTAGNMAMIQLSGEVGTVVRWEVSTDNFTTLTSIFNTQPTLTLNNLTRSTRVRAVVKNGTCLESNSNTLEITVNDAAIGGTVNGSSTVCSGINSGTLTLMGQVGNILRWERSTDGFATPVQIVTTSNVYTYTNLTETTQFRAVVEVAGCGTQTSVPATIEVRGQSVGGFVNGGTTVCSGTNSGLLTLTGNVGNVIHWERSDNAGFASSVTLNNTTVNQSFGNLTQDTYYRVLVGSANCTPVYSGIGLVTVTSASVGGTVTGPMGVCTGVNTGTLTLSGNVGMVVRWEVSTGGNVWTSVANTQNTWTFNNLTQTTFYRAVVKNGACPEANSASARVEVSPESIGGLTSGNTTICSGVSGSLNLTGNVGNVLRWEWSTDCSGFSNAMTSLTSLTTFNYTLTRTTCIRAVVKSGMCVETTSSVSRIEVTPGSNAGTIAGGSTVCGNNASGTLTVSGFDGSILRWERMETGQNQWTPVANNTPTLTYNNLTRTTLYRVAVQRNGCPEALSTSVEVNVSSPSVGGQLSGSVSGLCFGSNSGVVTLSGNVGNVVRWETSTDGGVTWLSQNNMMNVWNYSNLTRSTSVRVAVKNGSCPEALSNVVALGVSGELLLNAGSVTGCNGTGSITASASGGNGSYVYSLSPAIQPSNNTGQFGNVAPGVYVVRVTDANGCVNEQSVSVLNSPSPTSVVSVNSITSSSAVVVWASVPPFNGVTYNLRYRLLGEVNYTVLTGLTVNNRFISGLQNNSVYEVSVQYVCPGGFVSGWSTGVLTQFVTLPQGTGDCSTSGNSNVPVPGGIYVNNVTATSAQVNWNRVTNAQGYIISWGPVNVNPANWPQEIVCDPQVSYVITNLQPNTNYRVRMRTNCSNCFTALNNSDKRSIWSNQFAYTTPGSRLNEGSVMSTEVSVYPNPTKGQLTVNAPSGSTAELFDLTGRLVIRTTVEATATDLSLENLSSGVYTLKVNVGTEVKVIKVVKE